MSPWSVHGAGKRSSGWVRHAMLAGGTALCAWLSSAHAADYEVAPESHNLQQILDLAAPGDTIRIRGDWTGNYTVSVPVTILAPHGSIDAAGNGTVLTVDAPGSVVEGLTLRGSGDDLRGPDSGLYVSPRGYGARIQGVTIEDCAFGIWVHEAVAVRILDAEIRGRDQIHPSNRGNGIHLFDCDSVLVRGNHVVGARDGIYISATEHSLFENNLCEGQRFGIHYMFSHANTLRGNRSVDNRGGFALMESSDMLVEGNFSSGSTGHGILFRDAQRCIIRDNVLVDNAEGLFFYSSTENEITHNILRGNDVGAKIWAGSLRNRIEDNQFIGNRQQILYVSSDDLIIGEGGHGNYWSDYMGWDQDGDGIGDRPYRVDSFTANLLYRFPGSKVLMRSPALEFLSHLQSTFPLLKVSTLIDRSPLTAGMQP